MKKSEKDFVDKLKCVIFVLEKQNNSTMARRKYNLAKDSVSALMSCKQSLLYPRDDQNRHIVKNGKPETMNVVCTCSDNIFEDRNPNKPNLVKYAAAINKAKMEMCYR